MPEITPGRFTGLIRKSRSLIEELDALLDDMAGTGTRAVLQLADARRYVRHIVQDLHAARAIFFDNNEGDPAEADGLAIQDRHISHEVAPADASDIRITANPINQQEA